MEKIVYGIDPHNRLVAKKMRRSSLPTLRCVIDGEFRIAKKNTLVYHIKDPVQLKSLGASPVKQIKLHGKWSLTKNHDLKLTLDRWSKHEFEEDLTIKGEMLTASFNYLAFAITQKRIGGVLSTKILNLEGAWQADKFNRLNFEIKKEGQKHDLLVLDGIWEINKKHQIVYSYEKVISDDKKPTKRILVLRGRWDIKSRNHLVYEIDMDANSALDFKVGFQRAEKNYIKYEIGIGIKSKKIPVKKALILYGRWRIRQNTGLSFDMEYEKNHVQSVNFGVEAKLKNAVEANLALKNRYNEPLGVELTLNKRSINGEGLAFLKFLSSKNEKAVYVGAGSRW